MQLDFHCSCNYRKYNNMLVYKPSKLTAFQLQHEEFILQDPVHTFSMWMSFLLIFCHSLEKAHCWEQSVFKLKLTSVSTLSTSALHWHVRRSDCLLSSPSSAEIHTTHTAMKDKENKEAEPLVCWRAEVCVCVCVCVCDLTRPDCH